MSPQAHSTENPDLDKAAADVTRIQGLVDAGAMSRSALEKAQDELADAKDDAILNQTLYGSASVDELSGDRAGEMVQAAQREVDRQQARIDEIKGLVDQGVMARNELTPLLEELDRRRRTLDLANSRVRLLEQLSHAAEGEAGEDSLPEATEPETESSIAEKFMGRGKFTATDFRRVRTAFESEFGHDLPVSAYGMTRTHRMLGFDHRGRVDVALNPDDPEGVWLREYMEAHQLPFFAFRMAVPGKATGAHIHMGPPSLRITAARRHRHHLARARHTRHSTYTRTFTTTD